MLKSWELDRPLDIASLDLERFVKSWLADFDAAAGKHEGTLHTLIETLGRYIGETEVSRPKSPTDAATAKRTQQPTRRNKADPCRSAELCAASPTCRII